MSKKIEISKVVIVGGVECSNKYVGTTTMKRARTFIITNIKKKEFPRYADISKFLGKPTSGPGLVSFTSHLLWGMCLEDYETATPLLSCMIVGKDRGTPGSGFYEAANYLKRYVGSTNPVEQFYFWSQEVNKCIYYYGF